MTDDFDSKKTLAPIKSFLPASCFFIKAIQIIKQWTFPSDPKHDGEFITVVCLVQMRLLKILCPNKFLTFFLSTLLFRCVVSLRYKDPKSFS